MFSNLITKYAQGQMVLLLTRRTIKFVTLVNKFCIKGNKDNDNGLKFRFRAFMRDKIVFHNISLCKAIKLYLLIYFFTLTWNPFKMEYHKSTSMVPLMHFKCKTDEKGRIIKNYANRFWSVIEKWRYRMNWSICHFLEISFLTLPCFSSLLSSKSSRWWWKK